MGETKTPQNRKDKAQYKRARLEASRPGLTKVTSVQAQGSQDWRGLTCPSRASAKAAPPPPLGSSHLFLLHTGEQWPPRGRAAAGEQISQAGGRHHQYAEDNKRYSVSPPCSTMQMQRSWAAAHRLGLKPSGAEWIVIHRLTDPEVVPVLVLEEAVSRMKEGLCTCRSCTASRVEIVVGRPLPGCSRLWHLPGIGELLPPVIYATL